MNIHVKELLEEIGPPASWMTVPYHSHLNYLEVPTADNQRDFFVFYHKEDGGLFCYEKGANIEATVRYLQEQYNIPFTSFDYHDDPDPINEIEGIIQQCYESNDVLLAAHLESIGHYLMDVRDNHNQGGL